MSKQSNSKKFWDAILEHLKGRAIKLALKRILGSAATGGFKAWLVKFIVSELWEELAIPLIKAGLVEINYLKDEIKGDLTAKKIEKARKEGTNEDYDNAVDSSFE